MTAPEPPAHAKRGLPGNFPGLAGLRGADATDALGSTTPTPPDGCEAVWLPTDVVDHFATLAPPSDPGPATSLITACREAQARRGTTPSSAAPDHESSTGNGEGEALADVDQVHTQAGEGSGSPADPLRERIARAAAGGYMRVPIVALDGMYLGPPWLDVADAVLAVLPPPPDVVMHDGEPVGQWRYDALVAERDWLAARLEEADAERTKLRHKLVESAPPVPPSGDENDNIARLTEDQGDRVVNACCRMLSCEPADIDGDAAYEEILTEAVERCADLHGQDRWEDDCHGCGFRVGDHTTDGRCPPAPPWPGAVLSGLCDEDGVPTWLAQAGQVRGEQVRLMAGSEMWMTCSRGWSAIRWVEVRAPRAVPVPETERVPWWEAVGREVFDQDGERVPIEHVQCGDGGGPSVTAHNAAKRRDNSLYRVPCPVRGDGTVEVLKDGDR